MPYLFSHFKEKYTRDGEQVYFAISKDGYNWNTVNNGNPVVTCTKGANGCRDMMVIRLKTGGFVMIATDLCFINHMDENKNIDADIAHMQGSLYLSLWRSDDLINWGEQELIYFGNDSFGCLWAPEVFYDEESREYTIHWGSTKRNCGLDTACIYYTTTKDFKQFAEPKLLHSRKGGCIDSHIVKIDDTYHLFYKTFEPEINMHASSKNLHGGYTEDKQFEELMVKLNCVGRYEAATTYKLYDGKWCLMLDFFGCAKEEMGYIPFISSKPGDFNFKRCDELFSFPYKFKHGGVIDISDEEYNILAKWTV